MNYLKFLAVVFLVFSAVARADDNGSEQRAVLPADVRQKLEVLAGKCDILVLGETHGTKEVPAIVGELLPPLTKLGYRAIALEVPRDEQPAMIAWAKGNTDVVPKFFAKPNQDGRGNQQVLALVRTAVSPPFEWNLICFDVTEEEFSQQIAERVPKAEKTGIAEQAAKLSPEDIVAISVQRDATMARNLAADREKLPASCKVVAVCGDLHARTANLAAGGTKKLWPSFAEMLKRHHAHAQVCSVHVQAFSGEYFNGGKIRQFKNRPLADVEAGPILNGDWDWELNLPRATAATFFDRPTD
jgi:hypothetical protein